MDRIHRELEDVNRDLVQTRRANTETENDDDRYLLRQHERALLQQRQELEDELGQVAVDLHEGDRHLDQVLEEGPPLHTQGQGRASPGGRAPNMVASASTTRTAAGGAGSSGQADDRLGVDRLLKNPQKFMSEMETALNARGLGRIGPHSAIANIISNIESVLKAWKVTPYAGVLLISGLVDDCLREGVDAILDDRAHEDLRDQWFAVCRYLEERIYTLPLRRQLEEHRPRQDGQTLRTYLESETRWLREKCAAQGYELVTGTHPPSQGYLRPRSIDRQALEAAQLDLVQGLSNIKHATVIQDRLVGYEDAGRHISWNDLLVMIEDMNLRLSGLPKDAFSVLSTSKTTSSTLALGGQRTNRNTPRPPGHEARGVGPRAQDGCQVHQVTSHTNGECQLQRQRQEQRSERPRGDDHVDSKGRGQGGGR
ncbi:MAG: hypothetical protein ACOYNM_14115, partial [Gemmataceae bacterium]